MDCSYHRGRDVVSKGVLQQVVIHVRTPAVVGGWELNSVRISGRDNTPGTE